MLRPAKVDELQVVVSMWFSSDSTGKWARLGTYAERLQDRILTTVVVFVGEGIVHRSFDISQFERGSVFVIPLVDPQMGGPAIDVNSFQLRGYCSGCPTSSGKVAFG